MFWLFVVLLCFQLCAHIRFCLEAVDDAVGLWSVEPSSTKLQALRLVGLRLATQLQWDARSDLLLARVVACIFKHMLRSHATGVYWYGNGSWRCLDKIPAGMLMVIEDAIHAGQVCFMNLAADPEAPELREMEQVMAYLEGVDTDDHTILKSDFNMGQMASRTSRWWAQAGEQLSNIALRFSTTSGRTKSALAVYGEYMLTDLPPPNGFINLNDAAFRVNDDESGDRMVQKNKKPDNNCYFHIPCSLAYKPSDVNVRRVRRFLATTFASHPAARLIDLSMEALCLYGIAMPHKIVILCGPGGDGKSLRSMLRANVFGTGHKFMSPQALQKEDEFRVQGCHFGNAKVVTIQECKGGVPMVEDVFKLFVDGGALPCRPNYGEETQYLSWASTAKFWEMNLILPRVHGVTRRIPVIVMIQKQAIPVVVKILMANLMQGSMRQSMLRRMQRYTTCVAMEHAANVGPLHASSASTVCSPRRSARPSTSRSFTPVSMHALLASRR